MRNILLPIFGERLIVACSSAEGDHNRLRGRLQHRCCTGESKALPRRCERQHSEGIAQELSRVRQSTPVILLQEIPFADYGAIAWIRASQLN